MNIPKKITSPYMTSRKILMCLQKIKEVKSATFHQGIHTVPCNSQHKNTQWIQMVFPGWTAELEATWRSALRRNRYFQLCQSRLTIKISDVGEIHKLYRQSTSSASPSLSLDKFAKCLFKFYCRHTTFAPCTSSRENWLFPSFEKPTTSYQGGSQSLIVGKMSSWEDMYPFENHLWTNFTL